jgi:hypothetical protein
MWRKEPGDDLTRHLINPEKFSYVYVQFNLPFDAMTVNRIRRRRTRLRRRIPGLP